MSVIVLGETLPFVKEVKTFGNVKNGTFWSEDHLEFEVDGNRKLRIDPKKSAIIIVDMQNFFLHPDLFDHPSGLKCVNPLLKMLPFLRRAGVRIVWLNWGLTHHEVATIPPVFLRVITNLNQGEGGFGHDLGNGWGPALMQGARNTDLYGPLQDEWLKGKKAGTDVWFYKNRAGGLWDPGTAAGLYLKEEEIRTLFFAGVNTDQCVLGTLVDACFHGYDNILIKDATATTSPDHGFANVVYNSHAIYGFAASSENILKAV